MDPPPRARDRGSTSPSVPGVRAAVADATVVAYLAVVLVATVFFDGGRGGTGPLVLGITALLAMPAVAVEVRRSPRPLRLLVFAWGLGIVAAVVFAVHRADMTDAILTYALPPVAFLTACRLRRRRWGARVLAGLLLAGGAVYWVTAFVSWLHPPLEGFRSNWLAVSWHNPTGALMGAFALFGLAFTVRFRARSALPAAAVSALALAGLWLTGSRGALITTALGLVLTVLASRDVAWRRIGITGLGVLAGAVLTVGVLLQLGGIRTPPEAQPAPAATAGGETGLVRIEAGAAGNLRARFAHMDAALELFAGYPVTGAGMGAYGDLGNRLASPGANLTLSAHNEFAEALAEGGLIFGLPFILGGAAVAVLAVRRARPPERGGGPTAAGLSAGAAGVAVLLLVHSAVDIDWAYPVVPALLAIAAAILWDRDTDGTRYGLAHLAAVPLVLALSFGVGAASTEAWARSVRPSDGPDVAVPAAPWDLHRRVDAARALAGQGELEAAGAVLEPAAAWNPSSPNIDVMRAVIDYRSGRLDGAELTARLGGVRTGVHTYVLVAEALLEEDDLHRAGDVIREGFDLSSEHPGTHVARAELWELQLRLAIATDGCSATGAVIQAAAEDTRLLPQVDDIERRLEAVATEPCDPA